MVRRRGALASRIAAMQSAIHRLDLILYVFEADILFWWHHDLERPKNPRGNSSSISINKSCPPSKKRLCLKEDSLPIPPINGVFFVLSIFGVSSSTEAKRLWASCKSCGSVMATPEGFETMKRLGLASVKRLSDDTKYSKVGIVVFEQFISWSHTINEIVEEC